MAFMHNLLELSPRHLPPQLVETLTDLPGMDARCTAFGTLIGVPAAPVSRLATGLPEQLLAVLSYARDLDCDYLLVDSGFDIDENLPVWDT
ncbi:DUF5983 family protein [Rugosimonospora africana]|uniref:DUF5983 domain-containing protein n=1 Tax=Rugosimonospora africana TaxID=556532 RepID=A0A8J3VRL6_9ACTN|nr:hypothetical protein [Rugosimonospora africana]GIH16345.1 hypothetical protein Raf01_45170 [Rugosimonospora africana]